MSQLLRLPFTLLALIAITLSSPLTHASSPAPALAPEINDPDLSPLSYSPSPSYGDDGLSPEPQYPNEEEEEEDLSPIYPPSPLAYAPDIDEEYPYYAENPSPSPSPSYFDILAPEADDDDDNNDGFYYSPNEAPSPTESVYSDVMAPQVGATPPVMPFNYIAEDDDAGGQITSDSSYEEGYDGELNKKNRAVIGFVMGAICLVGLGAVVYKKRKNDQRSDHQMYMQLSKKDNDV